MILAHFFAPTTVPRRQALREMVGKYIGNRPVKVRKSAPVCRPQRPWTGKKPHASAQAANRSPGRTPIAVATCARASLLSAMRRAHANALC